MTNKQLTNTIAELFVLGVVLGASITTGYKIAEWLL
jgi:hypothetical protein